MSSLAASALLHVGQQDFSILPLHDRNVVLGVFDRLHEDLPRHHEGEQGRFTSANAGAPEFNADAPATSLVESGRYVDECRDRLAPFCSKTFLAPSNTEPTDSLPLKKRAAQEAVRIKSVPVAWNCAGGRA